MIRPNQYERSILEDSGAKVPTGVQVRRKIWDFGQSMQPKRKLLKGFNLNLKITLARHQQTQGIVLQ